MNIVTSLLAGLLMLVAGRAAAVGFQTATVPDPDDRPIEIGIWYPSDAPVPAEPNTPFRQALAVNGALAGDRLPLVIISHGKGGWLGAHADTALALAQAGFVVVAPTHTGDNGDDESYPPARWMVDRPRHLSRVLDYMLAAWNEHGHLDASRIGTFGFSAGGYTALVAIGGEPDLQAAADHCANDPAELTCMLGMASAFTGPTAAPTWHHEPRIKAAVVAAPGLGFAFTAKGLARVTAPVQLWAASGDRNVPPASNSDIVRLALGSRAEFHSVDGPGHFVFRPPCRPDLEAAFPKVWAMACVDPPGFDRAAFHRRFNADVVAFFERTLPAN
jgi:predicted dienelactone hydrolase